MTITQPKFAVPKNRLSSTHNFIITIPNKRKLQEITINYSLTIDFEDFMNTYKKCATKSYSVLVNDSIVPSDNLLPTVCNLLERV